jgi:hypothetical protein
MALPTSGPLSINDIRVELGASAINQSLGAFSDTAGFAAPDAITDFYGFSSLTSYVGSAFQTGVKLICNQTLVTTYYHNGSSAFPAVGDTIYTNSGGTTTIGGGNTGYNRINNFGYVLTSTSGVVTNVFACIS